VHRYVFGRAAPNLILRIVLTGVMSVSLVLNVPYMDFDDRAADASSLRVPAHMVADFEFLGHRRSPIRRGRSAEHDA